MTPPGGASGAAMRTSAPPAASAPGPRAGPDRAAVAPWVRAPLSVGDALFRVGVASLPCFGVALYNTGHQVGAVLSAGGPPAGWRGAALGALGLRPDPTNPLECLVLGALFFVPVLAAVGLAGGLAEHAFARARGRRADHTALPVFAVLLALSLPAGTALWQAGLAAGVGIVLGKEIFGGLGRSFLSPVVVALAFLTFAYPGVLRGDEVWIPVAGHGAPDVLGVAIRSGLDGLRAAGTSWSDAALGLVPGAMGQTSAAACGLGALLLWFFGVASWRILAGGVLGLFAGVSALQALGAGDPVATLPWHWHLVSGGFAFGLVYLATDPTSSAATNPGRWLHGAIVGGFVAVVRLANVAYEDGVVLALLLASVSAPLVDRTLALAQLRWNEAVRRG